MIHTPFLRLLCITSSAVGLERIFPNTTKEEQAGMEYLSVHKIKKWINESENTSKKQLEILSPSTMPAYSMAMLIKNSIAHSNKVITEKQLDVMQKRNPARCTEILKKFHDGNSANYKSETEFDDSRLFETRAELRIRWYRFLSHMIAQAQHLKDFPLNNILISFPELYYPIISELFMSEFPLPMEAFELSIFPHSDTEVVLLGRFRERTKSAYYNIEELNLTGNH